MVFRKYCYGSHKTEMKELLRRKAYLKQQRRDYEKKVRLLTNQIQEVDHLLLELESKNKQRFIKKNIGGKIK